jgi:magnesium transporter
MNFRNMPELAEIWGYPMALVTIVIAGLLPWLFFKRRGWL